MTVKFSQSDIVIACLTVAWNLTSQKSAWRMAFIQHSCQWTRQTQIQHNVYEEAIGRLPTRAISNEKISLASRAWFLHQSLCVCFLKEHDSNNKPYCEQWLEQWRAQQQPTNDSDLWALYSQRSQKAVIRSTSLTTANAFPKSAAPPPFRNACELSTLRGNNYKDDESRIRR